MCPIHLIKSPQQILGRSVDIVAARIIGEVIPKRRLPQLGSEEIDFVEEKDD